MKKVFRILPLLVALVALLALTTGCKNEAPAFQVNDVVSDPGAFSGTFTVVGVVNAFAQSDTSVVGIMDKKELTCTTPNCEKVLLPVKVKGSHPAMGDEIRVSGSFTKEAWGYLFNATSMEVIQNHKLGGQG